MDGPRELVAQAASAHNRNELMIGLDDEHPVQRALRDVMWSGVLLLISERDKKWTSAS